MLGLFARLSLQNNIVHSFLLLLLAFPPRFHSLSSFSLSLSRRSYASQILGVLVSPLSSRAVRARHDENNDAVVALGLLCCTPAPVLCCSRRVGLANTEGRRIMSRKMRRRYLDPRASFPRPRYSPLKNILFRNYVSEIRRSLDDTAR